MNRKGFAPLIVIGIITLLLIAGVVGYLVWKSSGAPLATTPVSGVSTQFTGTIQAATDESASDGSISIQVNGKWIWIGGGLQAPNTQMGSVTGLDFSNIQNNVGKGVAVFAGFSSPTDQNSLTLFGNNNYYVKLVQTGTSTSLVAPLQANQHEGCTLLPYTGTIPFNQAQYYSLGELEDLRGGMVCKFVINPQLPIFTLSFAGQADNTLGDIIITEGTSTKVIQTIPNTTSYDATLTKAENTIVPVDANFDGYKDLPILNQCGGTGNCSYDFYLYDPTTNHFTKNSFLSGLGTFSIDSSKQEVNTTGNGSYCYWGSGTYQYHNATYTLVQEISSNCDNVSTTVATYQLQNGKMQLMHSTTTPN